VKPRAPTAADRNPLNAYAQSFLEWSAVHGLSAQTIETRGRALKRFIAWCDERDLVHPKDVTLPILERYQRYLYHYRKPNGAPLTFGSQQTLLAPLKGFFQWAARERHLLYNPASELLLPRLPRRLPHHILTIADIDSILNQPDLTTPQGVRDRALLETLYSSGIRRMELVHLCLYDVDTRGGSLTVRAGKGGRDRVVPLGERAAAWLDRYLEEVRPVLVTGHDEGVCFLTDFGEPFEKTRCVDPGAHQTGGNAAFIQQRDGDVKFAQIRLVGEGAAAREGDDFFARLETDFGPKCSVCGLGKVDREVDSGREKLGGNVRRCEIGETLHDVRDPICRVEERFVANRMGQTFAKQSGKNAGFGMAQLVERFSGKTLE